MNPPNTELLRQADLLDLWEEEPDGESEPAQSPRVVDDFPLHTPIRDNEVFVIRNCESRYLTHTFHKYAGKFIPHVPRWALKRFVPRNSGAIVLDPFLGSGTTIVEAMIDGQHGYGFDIDPLARLISKVKTTLIPVSSLQQLRLEVPRKLAHTDKGSFAPAIPTLGHWFSHEAVADLSAIYEVVHSYVDEQDLYDFLLVCFSSIIRRASNADNQTMKTYVSHTNPKQPEAVRPLFLKNLDLFTDRLIKLAEVTNPYGRAHVLQQGDAATIDEVWAAGQMPAVDLAVTSPPYIKSVDYIYNQMAELFWIGHRWGLETQAKQNQFKKRYIGNDRPITQRDEAAIGIRLVDDYVAQVPDAKLADVARRYFRSMIRHFDAMFKVMKPGAHYVVVVGDSTLGGVEIPTHSLLSACAAERGFRLISQFAYEIRNKHMHFPRGGRGGVVLHDWVLDLVRN